MAQLVMIIMGLELTEEKLENLHISQSYNLFSRAVLLVQKCSPSVEKMFFKVVQVNTHKLTAFEIEGYYLCQQFSFSAIISFNEREVMLAAKLRVAFGIKGQSVDEAKKFRNKVQMKKTLSGKVSLPAFRKVNSPTDVLKFMESYPLVVLKPALGYASRGIKILSSKNDVKEAFETIQDDSKLIIEEFIDSPVYCMDGIWENNKIRFAWPMKYSVPLLNFLANREPATTRMLSKDNSITSRLLDFASDVLLGLGASNTVFHMECFVKEDGEILLCEIASRFGGGFIPQVWNHAFNFSLVDAHFLTQSEVDFTGPKEGIDPKQITGFVHCLPKLGTLQRISLPNFEWVVDYKVGSVGKTFTKLCTMDYILLVLITAPTEIEWDLRALQIIAFYHENFIYI